MQRNKDAKINRDTFAKNIAILKTSPESLLGLGKEGMEYILQTQMHTSISSASSIEILSIPKEQRKDISQNELRKRVMELISDPPSEKPFRVQYIIDQDFHYTAVDIYIGENEAKCFVLDAANEIKKKYIIDALLKEVKGTPLENIKVYDASGGTVYGGIQLDESSCPLFALDHVLILMKTNPYDILDKPPIEEKKETMPEDASPYPNYHKVSWLNMPFEYVQNAQNFNFLNNYKMIFPTLSALIDERLKETTAIGIGRKGPKNKNFSIELKHEQFAKVAINSLILEEKYEFLKSLAEKCNPNSELTLFQRRPKPSMEMKKLFPLLREIYSLSPLTDENKIENMYNKVEQQIINSPDYDLVEQSDYRTVIANIGSMKHSYSALLERLPKTLQTQLEENKVSTKKLGR